MIIGFMSCKLTMRGTEIAMYDYAIFNESLLGNKSIILTRNYDLIKHEPNVSIEAYKKFKDRFILEYYSSQKDVDDIVKKHSITHLYIIKGGKKDDGGLSFMSTQCKNVIHCVSKTNDPHGDVYSSLEEVNRLCNTRYPMVPHMINIHDTTEDMRNKLGIPKDAIVFGRYGGKDSFNLKFVHNCIKDILSKNHNIFFLFMNTNVFYNHPNIIYLDGTTDMRFKKQFINSCNAMLHARYTGETFGLAPGEFAFCLKPVLTWDQSYERSHINILGDKAILYNNEKQLYDILNNFHNNKYNMLNNGYLKYNKINVMKIFNKIYLQ